MLASNIHRLTTILKQETLSSSPILNSLLARNVASLSHERYTVLATFLNIYVMLKSIGVKPSCDENI